MADHAENIENKIIELHGKYNVELINKGRY
jgi:hypothetical protein